MRRVARKPGRRGGSPEPHDERTFRYLLGLEQRRSDRSGRPFLLVLVDTGTARNERPRIAPKVAATIFSHLSRCLRDTDFVGWYEDGLRAGAVLTELGEGSGSDIRGLLNDRLPADLSRRLQIQVSRYPNG